MNRILACLIGVSVAALPVVADARGNGSGGGNCATGSRGNNSSSHKSNHSGKGSYRVPYFSTFWLYGSSGYYRAGYVQPEGAYVEPSEQEAPAEPPQEFRNDCPPDMDCAPPGAPSAG